MTPCSIECALVLCGVGLQAYWDRLLDKQTGIAVSLETVRVYLHAHDYVCKRPTWTLRRKAEEQAGYVGKDCG